MLNDYCKDLRNVFLAYEELEVLLERSDQIPGLEQAMDRLHQIKETIQLDQILDDINEMIPESIEGAERVTNIVQNLKEFSHPDIDKPQMADIHESLDSALKMVWNELKYKAEVTKDYGDIPLILCYPQELKQVFMNLLVNASQAIESRGEINIRTYCNNGHVDVEIQDTGIGMTHDQITRIFDPFYTTKEVGKGTGLGLSISYRIAQKHGGLIKVLSKIGKGSIFIVKLPVENVPLENKHDKP